VLLDTHVFVWAVASPRRLSGSVQAVIEDTATTVLVSSVSAWEIATKHRLGSLPEAGVILRDYHGHLATFLAEDLSITARHALTAGAFQQGHRDPFDRLLAAQALVEGVPLVTNDPAFAGFPVATLW
jgi:PIN domain nuclease of toxin-antitoxin system